MKHFPTFLAASTMAGLMFFTACDDDPKMDAVAPQFKEIILSDQAPQMGQENTATIKFSSPGKSWYKLKYRWTLQRSGQEPEYYITETDSVNGIKEPTFTFVVPDTVGQYTLSVVFGTVTAASLFPNGSPYGSAFIENNQVRFNVTK